MTLRTLNDWFRTSNKLERIWLLAKIEYKLRYYENKLGLLWALIKPISDIFIYYIAFEVILKQGVPQFVSFLFLGLIIWIFFIESTTGTIQILQTKKYLYEYTNMNKIEMFLSTILSNCIGFIFNFVMFTIYYLLLDNGNAGFNSYSFIFIGIFLNLFILSLAFSLILASLYVIFKDISQIWAVVTGIGFWLSPILFKLEAFRKALPMFDYLNPISGVIINSRNVIMAGIEPEWHLFWFDFVYAIILLALGLLLLNRLGSKASEKL